MAQLPETFNAEQVEDTSFEPIPAGDYQAQIVGSEMKTTNAGDGQYLELTFEILGPERTGRMIWVRLNLVNPNPKAVEIAKSHLKQICTAVNKPVVQDSEELHGLPMTVGVTVKPAQGQYPAGNEIKSFKQLEGAVVTQPPVQPKAPWG